jgi:hypothetical protein
VKPDGTHEHWLDVSWQATPLPAKPTVPKLIPIVTTAPEADAVELAQTYTRRWTAQENAIRDWLIPLGIDVNHGFAKTAVINSEVAKKRKALQRRLDNVQRWADGARKRMHNASKLYRKRCQLTKERADALYRVLNTHQMESERQGMENFQLRQTIKEEKAVADTEIEEYRAAANGKPTTPATRSLPSVRSTAESSASCCEPLRIWHNRNVRCTNWTTARTRS